jgi:hypothetical protein
MLCRVGAISRIQVNSPVARKHPQRAVTGRAEQVFPPIAAGRGGTVHHVVDTGHGGIPALLPGEVRDGKPTTCGTR